MLYNKKNIKFNSLSVFTLATFCYSFNAIADPTPSPDCLFTTKKVGVELSGKKMFSDLWAFDDSFNNNASVVTYADLATKCSLDEYITLSAQGKVLFNRLFSNPGALEGSKENTYAFFNSAKATFLVDDNNFVDVGKLLIVGGGLFSYSPLDLIKNIIGQPQGMSLFYGTEFNESPFREGSYGVSISNYNKTGTYSLTYLPEFSRVRGEVEAPDDLSEFERTNNKTRVLLSYSTANTELLSATISFLVGDMKSIAAGISHSFSDDSILTVESAVHYGPNWDKVDQNFISDVESFEFPGKILSEYDDKLVAEFAIGHRQTLKDKSEVGIEYYHQTAGYSQSEWRGLVNTIKYLNGDYRIYPGHHLIPQSVFDKYAKGLAAELDTINRQKYLLQRHYATVYYQTNNNNIGDINYSASAMMNLVDFGTLVNVQIEKILRDNMLIYAGMNSAIGETDSEFAIFGQRLNVYSGLNYQW
ncbi:hypothetical protein [Thorsellia kenyensis]|uniref:Uncharacterized protein n=1 Tax=Thorsellia kenyensis TaxID=1549888 RepID=A0ABV6CBA3_9GAMM